jgi:hypothetical protein
MGKQRTEGPQLGDRLAAGPDQPQNGGIFPGQKFGGHAASGAGANIRQATRRHDGDGHAGFRIVEDIDGGDRGQPAGGVAGVGVDHFNPRKRAPPRAGQLRDIGGHGSEIAAVFFKFQIHFWRHLGLAARQVGKGLFHQGQRRLDGNEVFDLFFRQPKNIH